MSRERTRGSVLYGLAMACCLSVVWSTHARAQTADEAVRFEYEVPPECPDAAAFTQRVRERTSRGRMAEPGELARTFSVQIAAGRSGFDGSIAFLDDQGARVARRLHGEPCDAVVTSLALIAALALDATLREEDEAPLPPPTPPPASPLRAEPARTPAPAPSPMPQRPERPLSALQGARIGLGAGFTSRLHGSGPGLSPQLALVGQLDWRSAWALRLNAHVSWRDFSVDDGRRAALRLLGVETSVCPWRLVRGAVAFAPCGLLDLGSLRAEGELGSRLTRPGSATITWASVGAEARLGLEPSGSPLWAELQAGLEVPLRGGYRFQFDGPLAVVYRVPWQAGRAGVALGVRFW